MLLNLKIENLQWMNLSMAIVSFFSSFWPLYETELSPPFITSLYQSVNHTSLGLLQNLYDCRSEYWNHVFVAQCLVPLCRHAEMHALHILELVPIIGCGIFGCMLPMPNLRISTLPSSPVQYLCCECTEMWLDHRGLWWSRESRAVSPRYNSSWWKLGQPRGCSSLAWSSAWS